MPFKHRDRQLDILVVDDTKANLNLLSNLLREAGYTVRAAPSAELALTSAKARPPGLVLLDVRMPRMDGFELCRRLKAESIGEDVPVIFVSGQNDVSYRVKGFEVGGVDFISKPIQREEVLARVNTHYELSRKTRELKANQQKLETIFENLPLVFFSKDVKGRYLMINRHFESATGFTKKQVIGKTDRQILPSKIADLLMEIDQQVFAGKIPVSIEEMVPHPDGTIHEYLSTKVPLFDMQSQSTVLIGMSTDITKFKQLQEELADSKNQADAASKAKSHFISTMSHELRTPLNAILGYANLLHRDPQIGEQQKEKINIIKRSGESLLSHISEILDFTKIEANKITLNPVSCQLAPLIEDIGHIFQTQAEKKNISLNYHLKNDLCGSVKVDEKRLQQILLNLVANAIKFTDQGEVSIFVDAKPIDPINEQKMCLVDFKVQDTGVGIAANHLEKIFRPFEQVESNNNPGTGLGLNIAQKLVHLMGGEIAVESQIGKGSQFSFQLELPFAHGIMPGNTQTANIPEAYKGPNYTIMVVDDIEDNRLLLKDILSDWGFQVSLVSSGSEAVIKAINDKPDLILMDLLMPDMDGFQAHESLTKALELIEIPIIAMSASINQKERALKQGFIDFLEKPTSPEMLIHLLDKWLDLEWIYHPEEQPEQQEMNYPIPPEPDLKRLKDLAELGKIKQIIRWADQVQENQHEYASFAQHIKKLAEAIQDEAILLFIEKYLE